MTDILRMKQIYANILSNAIKYTPDGGKVCFHVHQEMVPEKGYVCIVAEISDTGIGMSEEFMEKMFNKFERATDTRVNTVSGYGLGLSIVKQLVDLMGGTLKVESRLGKGTTVRVSLKVTYLESVQGGWEQEETAATDVCRGLHLLVAEDNELNREVITELLGLHGITCDCAEDGSICLEQFKQVKREYYDAILMDMQMPNMNGIDAAKQIRMLPEGKTIPIIAMTANALQSDVEKCLEAGMNRHLSKPVDIRVLLKTLAEIRKEKYDRNKKNFQNDSGSVIREKVDHGI